MNEITNEAANANASRPRAGWLLKTTLIVVRVATVMAAAYGILGSIVFMNSDIRSDQLHGMIFIAFSLVGAALILFTLGSARFWRALDRWNP